MIIIILGTGVDEKRRLSKETVKRLKEGYKIHQKTNASLLVTGKYNFPYNEKNPPEFTEAQVMANYLKELGVEDILVDNQSKDTVFSAYNAKIKHFIPKNEKEAVIVTSDTHLNRVDFIFSKVFGEGYKLQFLGTPTLLSCGNKGIIMAKQNMLTQKAMELLEGVEEGDHEEAKKRVMGADFSVPKNLNYKKTC